MEAGGIPAPQQAATKLRAACCLAALLACALPVRAQPTPAPTPPRTAAPTTISAPQLRAQLQSARARLRALETRKGGGKRDATSILKGLVKPQIVRRADGATQRADGNRWEALAAGAADDDLDIRALKKAEVARLRRDVELQIAALDKWTATPPYQSVDAGAIVKDLEKSGQIRSGPFWWQAQIAAFAKAVGDAMDNFSKWLNNLIPKGSAPPPVSAAPTAPGFDWLRFAFWAIVSALLAVIAVLIYRVFAGNVRWNRRAKKTGETELQNEDAELLLLPPDELGDRATQFAREGNFREALRHRYIALLLRLDGRGIWRYDARRTNWEHVAALRREAAKATGQGGDIVAPLADLTRRFDRVRYGGASCDGADWQQFESDARALETNAGARESAGVFR